MSKLRVLAEKIVAILKTNAEIQDVYRQWHEVKSHREELYRNHPGPTFSLDENNVGWWQLTTSWPGCDIRHEAIWSKAKPLTADEDQELRSHLIAIVKAWIAEDDLYGIPMELQDVAKLFPRNGKPISVKTLGRWIDDGLIQVIALNKNMVRPLKTYLPQK